MERFYEKWALVGTVDPTGTGATGAATTDVIDVLDVSEVAFILSAGTIAATGTATFVVNSGTATGTVTTSVTAITALGATDDNKQVVVSVLTENLAAGHRYIAGTLTAGTAVGAYSVVALARQKYQPANEHDLASVDEIVTA